MLRPRRQRAPRTGTRMPQASKPAAEREPPPYDGPLAFEEGDFHALSERLCGDAQFNDRRLVARRKLAGLAKAFVPRASAQGVQLESRTSLHAPHAFNGMRVRRLWAYLTRAKAEKKRLRGVLGAELGKDLDAAYRNAYLCFALEAECFELSLRIHPEGWYDGQNLLNRLKREGLDPWRALLNQLGGFQLRMHDWKGEWRCGALRNEQLEEYLKHYRPGEHRMAVEKRYPAPANARGALLEPGVPQLALEELERLLPLYRYCAWSAESDHLFSR